MSNYHASLQSYIFFAFFQPDSGKLFSNTLVIRLLRPGEPEPGPVDKRWLIVIACVTTAVICERLGEKGAANAVLDSDGLHVSRCG
jgi:hypothetical protein